MEMGNDNGISALIRKSRKRGIEEVDGAEMSPHKIRNKSEKILERILAGDKFMDLVMDYPSMYKQIGTLMVLRPPRVGRTDLIYYFGPCGTGKTTPIVRVLRTLSNVYPNISHYLKPGGMDKWWTGYNNESITFIDDPISPDTVSYTHLTLPTIYSV